MPLRPPPDDAEDKLRDIRSVTDAALSHLDADELLAALLDRVRVILDGDTAAVLLLDSSGRQLVATAASGLEEEVSQGVRIPVGRGNKGLGGAREHFRTQPGTVLQHHLEAAGIANALHGRWRNRQHIGVLDHRKPFAQVGKDGGGGHAFD